MPNDIPAFARDIGDQPSRGPVYSFCTLVSRPALYAKMLHSFEAAGFTQTDCEFLYIDNTKGNRGDGYRGLNRLIAEARGHYVILCHQDLLAIDPRSRLDQCLAELDAIAPDWAVVGNSGYDSAGKRHQRLTDRYGYNTTEGKLPAAVSSLDENFLLIRRDALLGLSHDLSGFHLYGTDLALQADLQGRSAWVVGFHLEHTGTGRVDGSFAECLSNFGAKYRRALRARSVSTPSVRLRVGRFDVNAWFRAYKLRRTVDGKRPFSRVRALRQRLKALPYDLREWMNGPKFDLDGTTFIIPPGSPTAARKALGRGTYELPERRMIAKWLPRHLPVIELGGSYGIVSHAIRSHLAPDSPLVIVEANPALLDICTANVGLAGGSAATRVVGAALAYGADVVRFTVMEGIHTSHLETGTDPVTGGRTIQVPATSLAQLLAEGAVAGDFCLVCDIEGAEFDLLQNEAAVLSRCAMIVMEIHPDTFMDRGASVTDFRQMLSMAGFDLIDQEAQVIVARRR